MIQNALLSTDDLVVLTIPKSLAYAILQTLREASTQVIELGPTADDRRGRATSAFNEALMSAQVAQKCPSCGNPASALHRGVCRPCEIKLDAISFHVEREMADADENASAGIPTLLHGQVVRPQPDGGGQ